MEGQACMAGLVIGLWLLWGKGWLELCVAGRKVGASAPFVPHPSRVSWAPSRAGSFLAWLHAWVLFPLGSRLGNFGFVFPLLYWFPTAELPRNGTLGGVVKAGSCPQTPLLTCTPPNGGSSFGMGLRRAVTVVQALSQAEVLGVSVFSSLSPS